ncbi:putative methyltransferase-like protein 24 [Oratosquilla oratoria]|uniref:putative methyltransferase-like protein 24 n=1 Tax=Oratosquilla oratoria TaxID=337810 RepID=UPI003F7697FE
MPLKKADPVVYASIPPSPWISRNLRFVIHGDPVNSTGSFPGIRDLLDLLMVRDMSMTDPDSLNLEKVEWYTSPSEGWFLDPKKNVTGNSSLVHLSYFLGSSCRKLVRQGGNYCHGDREGSKLLCLDEGLFPSLNQKCLLYSFGVGMDSTFEVGMVVFHRLCTVFLFDDDDEHREEFSTSKMSRRMHFEAVRLGPTNAVQYTHFMEGEIKEDVYRYMTYDTIRENLGHRNTTIHYLKVDIEGFEWDVFRQILQNHSLDGVLQISMEIHLKELLKEELSKGEVSALIAEYYKTLQLLAKSGFELVYVQDNILFPCVMSVDGVSFNGCKDTHWLRRKHRHKDI